MGGLAPNSWTVFSEKFVNVFFIQWTFQWLTCLLQNSVEFTTNIDITSYQDGKRETHNPDGRAVPQVVWDYFQVSVSIHWLTSSLLLYVSKSMIVIFQEGCSVRLLNPQTYSKSMWLLVATLQEYFQSFVGANV